MKKVHVLFLLSLINYFGFSQSTADLSMGHEYELHSKVLNEKRTIIVGLPQNYDPEYKTYSVIVLLDGDYHFISAYGNIEYLSKRFVIPESILIAVPNTNRVRDLTPTKTNINFDGTVDDSLKESGGATNFLRFLEDELIPWVRENFATNDQEVIIGHSWGGLVVTKAFLKNETKFDKFLAIDPSYWWDNQVLTKEIKVNLKDSIPKGKRLFISASSFKIEKENGKCCKHRNSIDLFYSTVKETTNANEQLALRYFEDEDHASVPVPSTYYGLKFLFKDFVIENVNNKTFEEIEHHFLDYFSSFQNQAKIPEDLVRNVGQYKLYAKNEIDKAMKFFTYNIENYPNSVKAHQSISGAYSKIEELTLAKKHKEIADRLKSNK